MVDALVADGAMVAAIDTPHLLSAFEADKGDCVYAVGDFENLSHFVQAWAHLPTYLTPILAGHAAGATLAYGILAQAEVGSFTGAMTTAFCPDLNLAKRFCAGNGAVLAPQTADSNGVEFLPTRTLAAPWVTLHGEIDQVCPVATVRSFVRDTPNASLITVPKVGHAFAAVADWRAAYHDAVAGLETTQSHDSLPPPPGALNDLPIIEVEASGRPPRAPPMPTPSRSWSPVMAAGPASTRTWPPISVPPACRWSGSIRCAISGPSGPRKALPPIWSASSATTARSSNGRGCC